MSIKHKTKFAVIPLSLATVTLASLIQPAMAVNLGIAQDYNVFVFGDMNQSSDSEGRVAVGGNATFTNFGIADRLANSNGTDTRLIVGGDLTYNGGQVFGGNAVVGGSVKTSVNFNCSPNCGVSSGTPLNFETARQELTYLSESLGGLSSTGNTEYKWGGIHLQGNNSDLNIFTIDGSQFSNSTYLNIAGVGSNSTVIFNILGNSVNISNFGLNLNGLNKQNILFNFVDATQVKTTGFSFYGSVLATKANVLFNNGNVEGTLVASSLSGSGEFHNTKFAGNLPNIPKPQPETPTNPTPETPTNPTPETPETPTNPTPETPVTPTNPTPETPETPTNPTPETPETPTNPTPETPETPTNPTPEPPVSTTVPEPSTVMGLLFVVGLFGFSRRNKLSTKSAITGEKI
ncbi:choice-of-anchor A family protein [Aulosira sp. FACHB-615]|uniref:choice-of-anchor A family protein n=1 Tax=Aulosira sp. FACHB-615 TaxID=2692777 RepID=UPI0016832377|nr:choice-of-anchor A family protein [Aulosira sp. FACHB-615]MBD2488157.1 choice-of-anchor A family protein [Aulosira sp. FACHB-615]